MKVLVIPDVHLKPWMFKRAAEIKKKHKIKKTVCLMDLLDDWGKQNNVDLYEQTIDAAIDYARSFPQTLWCMGNHDVSYLFKRSEAGYSITAEKTVIKKMEQLKKAIADPTKIAYIHRIDKVLFMHGGLSYRYVFENIPESFHEDTDKVISIINTFGEDRIWQHGSPIWLRPQYYDLHMYKGGELLQVVGHTPVSSINECNSVLSCDVFSTYQDGSDIGNKAFPVIDTKTKDFYEIAVRGY